MRKKTKPKRPSRPKSRKAESDAKEKPGTKSPATAKDTAKDKEELIRIWDEDLCE